MARDCAPAWDPPPSVPVPLLPQKFFGTRLSKTFVHLPFPNFNETGKDWDSKAKAHLRSQIKTASSSKQIDLTTRDLRRWSDKGLRDVSNLLWEMLSVRDNLVDFCVWVS